MAICSLTCNTLRKYQQTWLILENLSLYDLFNIRSEMDDKAKSIIDKIVCNPIAKIKSLDWTKQKIFVSDYINVAKMIFFSL